MGKPSQSLANLLAQIARIDAMEFGKLSEHCPRGRSKDSAPYHKLQIWQDGRNITRHVRPEELPALRQALEGYARFQSLADEYARLVVSRTRARLIEDSKKKKILPYSRHSARKSTGSSSPS